MKFICCITLVVIILVIFAFLALMAIVSADLESEKDETTIHFDIDEDDIFKGGFYE